MKLCGHCQRHVLDEAQSCPFCQQRTHSVGAAVLLGVALGLCSTSCSKEGGDSDGSSVTTPIDDDMGGSYYAGPTTMDTWDSFPGPDASSTTADDDDQGGSYYAGPSPSSTTWEDPSSSTTSSGSSGSTGSTGATDTGGSGETGQTSSATSPEDQSGIPT